MEKIFVQRPQAEVSFLKKWIEKNGRMFEGDVVMAEDVLLDDVDVVVAVTGDGHWFFVSNLLHGTTKSN